MGMHTVGYVNSLIQRTVVCHGLGWDTPTIGLKLINEVRGDVPSFSVMVSGKNAIINSNREPKRIAVSQAGHANEGMLANPPSRGPNSSPGIEVSQLQRTHCQMACYSPRSMDAVQYPTFSPRSNSE
jgi:hypothetical protein